MNRPGLNRIAAAFLAMAIVASALPAQGQTTAIRDEAGMFSQAALAKAESRIKELRTKSTLPVTIQTRPNSQGQDAGRYAVQLAKTYAGTGLYVLILKDDRKIEVLWHDSVSKRITNDDKDKIRAAISGEFKKQNFDGGLSKGLDAIADISMRFATGKPTPSSTPPLTLPVNENPLSPSPAPSKNFTPAPPPAPAAAQPSGSVSGVVLILFLGVGFLILVGVLRAMSSARSYNAGMPPGGGPGQGAFGPGGGGPGGYGPSYGPGYGGGGGGGFFRGVMGGLGGAILGNWVYNSLGGHGHHDHSHGSMTGMGHGGWGSTPIDPGQQQSDQWHGADDGGDWSSSASNSGSDWGSSSSSDSGGWSGADSGGDWGGGSSDSGSTDW